MSTIRLIQHATTYDTGSASTTVTVALSNVKPGDLIVVAICAFTSTVSSVTDNASGGSNTYTATTNSPAVNGNDRSYLYYAKNVVGGNLTITVTFNAGSHVRSVGAYEYMGADISSPFDKDAAANGTSTTVSPGSITPTNNGSLIVSVGGDFVSGGTGSITAQTSPAFTLEDSQTDNTTHERYYYEDYVQVTSAALTPSFTIANSANWRVVAAVFKPGTFATISSMSDGFQGSSIDATKWNTYLANSGTISESGGSLNETPANTTNGSWAGVYSKTQYDLTGDIAFVKQIVVGAGNTFFDLTLSRDVLPSNNFISIGVDTGLNQLQAGDEINGTFTVRAHVTYNVSTMQWVRIRESAGTVYFEYAASSSGPWTTLDSRAAAINITALYVVLDDFEYNALGSPGTAQLAYYNTTPSTTTHLLSALGAGT